jgi:hypothetical protein
VAQQSAAQFGQVVGFRAKADCESGKLEDVSRIALSAVGEHPCVSVGLAASG